MAFDPVKVGFGPCRLTYGGVVLESTKGGTTLSYAPEVFEMTADEFGNTPYDAVLIGEVLTISTNLLMSDWEQLQAAMPGGTLVIDATDQNKKKLTFGGAMKRFGALAKELTLHPLEKDDTDTSADVTVYKAIAWGNVDLAYNLDGEKVVPVEFHALLDTSRPKGDQLFCIGDKSATAA